MNYKKRGPKPLKAKKTKMKKRAFSLLLAMVMLLGLLPTLPVRGQQRMLLPHSHPICGAACLGQDDTHAAVEWIEWDGSSNITIPGNYYLTGDAAVQTSKILISADDVHICLNGHTIDLGPGSSFRGCIEISGRNLTLCDCDGDGIITGSRNGDSGSTGCLLYVKGAGFTIYGGTLKNTSTASGHHTAMFIGNGGSVDESIAVSIVGGTLNRIKNMGTLTMTGGVIDGTLDNGSGIFKMSGGTIRAADGETAIYNNKKAELSGSAQIIGESTGASAAIRGNKILTISDNVSVTSGSTCAIEMAANASMTLSGNPIITGKTVDLKLSTGANTTLDNARVDATGYTGNALTVQESRLYDSTIGAYAIKGGENKFTLIDSDYEYQYENGGMVIRKQHSHSWASAWTTNATHHWHECTAADCPATSNNQKNGYGEHTYVTWKITKNPTEAEKGTAERVCTENDGHKETKELPVLTDTTVWMAGDRVEPTEEKDGSQKYTSVYGEVTVILSRLLHTHDWGTWTITKNPTETERGAAERICTKDSKHKETKELPVLTDTTVWMAGDRVEPTEEKDGSQKYTSVYGEVTVILSRLLHTHDWGTWTITKNPTETERGAAERICTKDSKHKETKELPVLTDTTVWMAGDRVEPTEEKNGTQKYTSVYGEVTVILPATGTEKETGTVTQEVKPGKNAPAISISTPTAELEDMLLTDDEKQQLQKGSNIRIILEVQDAGNTVSSLDKAGIEQASDGFNVGQYLNIDLYKLVEKTRTDITETSKKIKIVIDVPDSLKSKDSGKPRTYAIIRMHGGMAETLADLDNDADKITIATDCFSTYAIVYKEAGEDIKPSPEPPEKETAAGKEERKIEIHSALKAVQTGKKLQISWGKVTGADGYSVYVQYCGKSFSAKSLNQVKSGKKTKITVNKVNGKKLDTTKNFKMYVVAWQWKNGKKSTLAKTLTVHIAGKDSAAYTNVKTIQVKKTSYTLKKGSTVTLRPKAILYSSGKKQLSEVHTKNFRYMSSNQKVAAVTEGGKVKAKGTGSCTVYVFAKNGCNKTIKIKVRK